MTSEMPHTISLLARQQISQHLDRVWMNRLSASDYKVVRLIFDRTISWGNWSEQISVPEFHRGRGGLTDGSGLSERTVIRCLASLEDRGIIVRECWTGHASEFALNILWGGTADRPVREPEINWGC